MANWVVEVTTWPYSTGAGGKADKEAIGGTELHPIAVKGETIQEAIDNAGLFVAGIKTNPRVWKAFISGVKMRPR